jgi:ankyrin repeat protein
MPAETPLYMAIKNCHTRAIQALMESGANKTPVLIRAIVNKDNEVFFNTLKYTIDSEIPQGLLDVASMMDTLDARIPTCLIQRYGLNINRISPCGNTPLHNAAKFGGIQTVCALLNFGADVNLPNSAGHTPLLCVVDRIISAVNDDVGYEICDELLNYGADPTVEYNNTPIWKIAGCNTNLADLFERWGYF